MPSKSHSRIFRSYLTDRVRAAGNKWVLPGGQLLLPRVFGFCRGVERALEMLEKASMSKDSAGKKFFLLGQIIHNPWVNEHFRSRGEQILGDLFRRGEAMGEERSLLRIAYAHARAYEARRARTAKT